jgi:hypothetical protein
VGAGVGIALDEAPLGVEEEERMAKVHVVAAAHPSSASTTRQPARARSSARIVRSP